MALSYKARKRWSLVVLLVWLPIWILIATGIIIKLNPENPIVLMLLVVFLAFVWVLPFKGVFKGVGKPDPDAPPEDQA